MFRGAKGVLGSTMSLHVIAEEDGEHYKQES